LLSTLNNFDIEKAGSFVGVNILTDSISIKLHSIIFKLLGKVKKREGTQVYEFLLEETYLILYDAVLFKHCHIRLNVGLNTVLNQVFKAMMLRVVRTVKVLSDELGVKLYFTNVRIHFLLGFAGGRIRVSDITIVDNQLYGITVKELVRIVHQLEGFKRRAVP